MQWKQYPSCHLRSSTTHAAKKPMERLKFHMSQRIGIAIYCNELVQNESKVYHWRSCNQAKPLNQLSRQNKLRAAGMTANQEVHAICRASLKAHCILISVRIEAHRPPTYTSRTNLALFCCLIHQSSYKHLPKFPSIANLRNLHRHAWICLKSLRSEAQTNCIMKRQHAASTFFRDKDCI